MKCVAIEKDQVIADPVFAHSSLRSAGGAEARVRREMLPIRWLREPLAHFLLIGLALFLLNGALNHAGGRNGAAYRIALTDDDLRQLRTTFAAQWQRAPSRAEMQGLAESKVREEVLYREGVAQGLDKDDTIVKRRMAQKMQFLAEDVAAAHEPSTAELKRGSKRTATSSPCPAVSASAISTSLLTSAGSAQTMLPKHCPGSAGQPKTRSATRWPIRSCFRTTMATAHRRLWPRSSGRNLLWRPKAQARFVAGAH